MGGFKGSNQEAKTGSVRCRSESYTGAAGAHCIHAKARPAAEGEGAAEQGARTETLEIWDTHYGPLKRAY